MIYVMLVFIAVFAFTVGLIVGLAVKMKYTKKASEIKNTKYLF